MHACNARVVHASGTNKRTCTHTHARIHVRHTAHPHTRTHAYASVHARVHVHALSSCACIMHATVERGKVHAHAHMHALACAHACTVCSCRHRLEPMRTGRATSAHASVHASIDRPPRLDVTHQHEATCTETDSKICRMRVYIQHVRVYAACACACTRWRGGSPCNGVSKDTFGKLTIRAV